jgi:CheY-like chemotaxis protein
MSSADENENIALRILVVDDLPTNAKLLQILLTKVGGHEVRVAHDGPSAIETAEAFRPDLIFLDIGMPHMTGYEVARRLRRQPHFADTLIVALTGYGLDEDRHECLEAGIDEHLLKPPSIDALRVALAHPKLQVRRSERNEPPEEPRQGGGIPSPSPPSAGERVGVRGHSALCIQSVLASALTLTLSQRERGPLNGAPTPATPHSALSNPLPAGRVLLHDSFFTTQTLRNRSGLPWFWM